MLKIILIFNFVRRGFRECFDSKNNLTIDTDTCGNFFTILVIVIFVCVLFWILKKMH